MPRHARYLPHGVIPAVLLPFNDDLSIDAKGFRSYLRATGQGCPRDTLLKMVDEVPSIRASKDWAGNVPQHEMHIRTLQRLPRPVNVLTTHSAWLLSSLVLGCNGLLSGSGSVIPELQAELFRAVQAKDLTEAQRLNDRIY